MFIKRNFDRTENDDFALNVTNHLRDYKEAMPIYNNQGLLIGWKIQNLYD